MKFDFDVIRKSSPDPFIFGDSGKYYLYATGYDGVETYSADSIGGKWKYEGLSFQVCGGHKYWAPSVIKLDGIYYMYVSCSQNGNFEFLRVASAESPLGPFTDRKILFDRFTIDSHVVKTEGGLFLFYAENDENCARPGTRVFVDRLLDPLTPANLRREVISPDKDEEYTTWDDNGKPCWTTIEGPFWFSEGGWQYLMYSSGSFLNDTYHVGYCSAKSDETDLTKVDFIKRTYKDDVFTPVLSSGVAEEGTGHNSVIKVGGEYYAVYHARDVGEPKSDEDTRTARYCRLAVGNGVIKAGK